MYLTPRRAALKGMGGKSQCGGENWKYTTDLTRLKACACLKSRARKPPASTRRHKMRPRLLVEIVPSRKLSTPTLVSAAKLRDDKVLSSSLLTAGMFWYPTTRHRWNCSISETNVFGWASPYLTQAIQTLCMSVGLC